MKDDAAEYRPVDAENDLPYKLSNEGKCEWLRVDGKRFTEPFFDGTIRRCITAQRSEIKQRETGVDEIPKLARLLPAVKPAVIIFHISRCGSTLATQAFATSANLIVLSEVPFFDNILQWPLHNADFAGQYDTIGLFEASLRFYGRKRHPGEENVIIKTDCWHIFFYAIFRRLFPDVPFILMYRNPPEVLRSLMKVPGMQVVPQLVAPEIFGLPGMPEVYNPSCYTATILEKMFGKFIFVARNDANTVLVNYNEGPVAAIKKIALAAGLSIGDEEFSRMKERAHYHSKRPGEQFLDEPAADVPEHLKHALDLYGTLDGLRLGKH
jgi:hypothetical protein